MIYLDYPFTPSELKLIDDLTTRWMITLRWYIENPTALGRHRGELFDMLWDQAIIDVKPLFASYERWMKAVIEIDAVRFRNMRKVCRDVEFFMDCHFHTLIPTPDGQAKADLIDKWELFNDDFQIIGLA